MGQRPGWVRKAVLRKPSVIGLKAQGAVRHPQSRRVASLLAAQRAVTRKRPGTKHVVELDAAGRDEGAVSGKEPRLVEVGDQEGGCPGGRDRKSTRLNSSH